MSLRHKKQLQGRIDRVSPQVNWAETSCFSPKFPALGFQGSEPLRDCPAEKALPVDLVCYSRQPLTCTGTGCP